MRLHIRWVWALQSAPESRDGPSIIEPLWSRTEWSDSRGWQCFPDFEGSLVHNFNGMPSIYSLAVSCHYLLHSAKVPREEGPYFK